MSFADFFARARTEAARYGPDPWIFVRELLQNARDAGATRVDLDIELGPDFTRLRCADDGEGMSFEHARAYLFSLYASSKESDAGSVGKFGVGFWSVLRFEPARIWIRSRARGHEAWEIELAADAAHAQKRKPALARGTEVILERASRDIEAQRRLLDAVRQNARFLRQRDADKPLAVHVGGIAQNADFDLPPPVAHFRSREGRGVVALGASPRVELFSKGLRVRAASCLEDLLSDERASSNVRVRFPSVDGIMAPQVLLESDGIEPLLSRSDARDDAQLRRLVTRAQSQLRRLVRRQLDSLSPPGIFERIRELFRGFSEAPLWAQVSGAAVFGALIAVVLAPLLWPMLRPPELDPVVQLRPAPAGVAAYRDLSRDYHGPAVSELDPSRAMRLDLRYAPTEDTHYFGLLMVEDFSAQASREAPVSSVAYRGARCEPGDECLRISLGVDAAAGPMRVPLPTGHRLDPSSLALDASSLEASPLEVKVVATVADEAVLMLDAPLRGALSYAAKEVPAPRGATPEAPALPAELARWVPALRRLPSADARVEAALERVRARVPYRVDAQTEHAHEAARAAGTEFLERALEVGAGDCDVQNGVLAAVLQAAGVEARLVVGVVGVGGRAQPWLHAWLEYRDDEGRWRVADASEGANVPGLDLPPSFAGEPTVAAAPSGAAFPPLEGPAPSGASAGTSGASAGTSGASANAGVESPAGTASSDDELEAPRDWRAAFRSFVAEIPPTLPAMVAAASAALAFLAFLLFLRIRRASLALGEQVDLVSMLQGALRQPQAFRQLPELFTRRLVPRRRGAPISLVRARELSARGELFWGRGDSRLCRDAAARGVTVLDGARAEGEAVATTLGAIDLDALGELESKAHSDPLVAAIEAQLGEAGVRWRIRIVEGLDRRIRSVDLQALHLARAWKLDRLVYLDAEDALLDAARKTAERRPAAARFGLLDEILARVDLPARARAELSHAAAAEALLELDTATHAEGGSHVRSE